MAELEAAQAAAQAALLAEMDLLRRQKAAAEEQARRLETQARSPKFPPCPCSPPSAPASAVKPACHADDHQKGAAHAVCNPCHCLSCVSYKHGSEDMI